MSLSIPVRNAIASEITIGIRHIPADLFLCYRVQADTMLVLFNK